MTAVVEAQHRRFALGQDFVVVLHHDVGRQTAVFLGQRHGATGGMKAHPEIYGSGDFGGKQIAGTARV